MNLEKVAAIVLAGGKGTRLAGGKVSQQPKVLYKIGGRPMIIYIVETLEKAGFGQVVLTVGHKAQEVEKLLGNRCSYAYQRYRLGTGHAFKIGLEKISPKIKEVVSMYGDDSAFYQESTIKKLVENHLTEQNKITFATLYLDDPTGLGRIVRRNGQVAAIVEEKVANRKQKEIKEINTGLYVFDRLWVSRAIKKIKKSPVGEYYITD
jgi:bifunctional UDP-N-acetylglucosamine pyrophosphorylase/glucosamine-1-phosphate N-acetyltransferase